MSEKRYPVVGPSVWRSSDFSTKTAYSVALSPSHLKAFDQDLQANREACRDMEKITLADFPLSSIADDVSAWRDEVLYGRGFVVLQGFPMEHYSQDEIETIYWGLGAHFGRAVSQSNLGDFMGHVIDVGGKDRRERAYRNSSELTLHTDRADVLGMLCLRKAMSGGVSGYASIHAIHNHILATRPELLEPLFLGFNYHRRGEQQLGEAAVTPDKVPVLSEWQGHLSVVFLRSYIEMSAQELGEELTEIELEALDYFESVAASSEFQLHFTLEPGEVIFFNNCFLLHNRTSFEDDPDPELRRHLLRLWLMLDGARPLAPAVHAYKGTVGIQSREDQTTYYTGTAIPEPIDRSKVVSRTR